MNLAEVRDLHQVGKLSEAEAGYRDLLREQPACADAMYGLGMLQFQLGRIEDALELLAAAIQIEPNGIDLKIDLGVVQGTFGRHAQAAETLRQAIELNPTSAAAHDNYGIALDRLHKAEEAHAAFRRAVELDPAYFGGLLHLGINWRLRGKSDEAMQLFDRAKAIRPNDAELLRQLAALSSERGDVQRMIGCYMQLLKSPGANPFDYSALVFGMHYNPAVTRDVLFAGAKAWAGRYAEPLTADARTPQRNRTHGRTLRVGYISSDLREHPAGRLLAPVLNAHDRSQVRTYCYADMAPGTSDNLTFHLAGLADEWREIAGINDDQVHGMIEEDQIDILVELNGHFGNHRLPLLARRVAPIQISAFGYCDTTGLTAIDYRITDTRSDPPGVTDAYHTEKLIRLEGSCWCYQPWDTTPAVRPPPFAKHDYVTFGNLNNPVKTTDQVAQTWTRIIRSVPNSRLILLTARGSESHVANRFTKLGIPADQLLIASPGHRAAYVQTYHLIDIALDPFPFNGDNTTCDAIWMGVPVVSLLGDAFWSRRGFSHLAAVGLSDLVANDPDHYVQIAVALANDPLRLVHLRAELRRRLQNCTLGNITAYIAELEPTYRRIWIDWCNSQLEGEAC